MKTKYFKNQLKYHGINFDMVTKEQGFYNRFIISRTFYGGSADDIETLAKGIAKLFPHSAVLQTDESKIFNPTSGYVEFITYKITLQLFESWNEPMKNN